MNIDEWDRRADRPGLHAVLSARWSNEDCVAVSEEQQELIISSLPDLTGRVVLDLGCGIGRLSTLLSERATQVIGLDVSQKMLQRARTDVRKSSVSFVLASAGYLPFPKGAFDVVIASFVLQHILDEVLFERTLKEIACVTKPNGLALLFDSLADVYHRPTNSVVTMIRTWQQYVPLQSTFRLLSRKPWRCVEDNYTVMLWQRKDD